MNFAAEGGDAFYNANLLQSYTFERGPKSNNNLIAEIYFKIDHEQVIYQ